jgi:hypothetical protein
MARAHAGYKTPKAFLDDHRDETEAVVIRIGLNDAQLVLVDGEGRWDRWVYHSVEEAKDAAAALGLEAHVGEYPEKTRVRMNSYRKPREAFETAAYPEQGRVGPVIPYPENRPRPAQRLPEEGPAQEGR